LLRRLADGARWRRSHEGTGGGSGSGRDARDRGCRRDDHGYYDRHRGDYARDRDYGREGPAFRYGFDRGWREGSEEGGKDGRRGKDPRYWRESEFRDADRGYKRWMGPRRDYSSGFREGYRDGYRRAYAASRPGWRGRWERYGWSDSRHDVGRGGR
jgi:hypothetical protein